MVARKGWGGPGSPRGGMKARELAGISGRGEAAGGPQSGVDEWRCANIIIVGARPGISNSRRGRHLDL